MSKTWDVSPDLTPPCAGVVQQEGALTHEQNSVVQIPQSYRFVMSVVLFQVCSAEDARFVSHSVRRVHISPSGGQMCIWAKEVFVGSARSRKRESCRAEILSNIFSSPAASMMHKCHQIASDHALTHTRLSPREQSHLYLIRTSQLVELNV